MGCYANIVKVFGVASKIDTKIARTCDICVTNWQNVLTNLSNGRIIIMLITLEVRSMRMKMSYKKLWIMLVEKEISQSTLRKDLNIATGTMTKLRKNEEVALSILLRICEYLNCNIGDICDAVVDESEVGDEE